MTNISNCVNLATVYTSISIQELIINTRCAIILSLTKASFTAIMTSYTNFSFKVRICPIRASTQTTINIFHLLTKIHIKYRDMRINFIR